MITPFYAGVLGLMYVGLSVHVIRGRRKVRAAIGDANSKDMQCRIRAHGNFAEYAPFFVLLLWMAEQQGLSHLLLHVFAFGFIAGRALHAYSALVVEQYDGDTLTTTVKFRIRGMICTFTTLALVAISNIWLSLF